VAEESAPILYTPDTADPPNVMFLWSPASAVHVTEVGMVSTTGTRPSIKVTITGLEVGGGVVVSAWDPASTAVGQRPLAQVAVEVSESTSKADLVYTGKWLYWKTSLPPSLQNATMRLFAASSGYTDGQTDYRYAKYQGVPNAGPIPAGQYQLSTAFNQLSPDRPTANKRWAAHWDLNLPSGEGITYLPTNPDGSPVSTPWGLTRTALTPVAITPSKFLSTNDADTAKKRNGFYLHDSRKHQTSGCIEVGHAIYHTSFFMALIEYARYAKKKKRLYLSVQYADPNQFTRAEHWA